MKKWGVRLDQASTSGTKSLGIEYDLSFELWESAVAAGAGLDELHKLDQGLYPKHFKAKLITWFRFHELLELHREIARQPKPKK